MIIMRALVATVLLITVVLVSIVLINANSRHVRSSATIAENGEESHAEVDETEVQVLFDGSFEEDNERMGLNPEQERKSYKIEESLTESVKSTEESTLINAIKKVTKSRTPETRSSDRETLDEEDKRVEEDEEEEQVVIMHENASIDTVKLYEDKLSTEDVVMDSKSAESSEQEVDRSPTTLPLTTEGDSYNETVPLDESIEQDNEGPEDTFLESKTLNDIKARSKEIQWAARKTSPATERQTPLGYEPESYIVLDEEPDLPAKTRLDENIALEDDLDPISSISSRPLERKQRAALGSPETIVLNRAPIVPHISDFQEPGCAHMFPPLSSSRFAKSVDHPRPSFADMPSIYNPNQQMNILRSPQCTACQRKKVPLCVTCGRCSECCSQSGCTCGCLQSQ